MFNTEDLYNQVGAELVGRRGRRLEPELLRQMMGRPSRVALDLMIQWYGLPDTVEQLEKETVSIFRTVMQDQLAAMPGGAALDMPAGPSEVLVIADGNADPEALCWDLLSQAEHGPDSQSILLSDDGGLLDEVGRRLPGMAAGLPRADILAQSLRHLRRIEVASMQTALAVSNRYAPEHLILNCRDAEELSGGVTAGPAPSSMASRSIRPGTTAGSRLAMPAPME